MSRRNQADYVGSLPVYVVGDNWKEYLGNSKRAVTITEITCPRKACGETFIVRRARWEAASDKVARACPYCFKAARLP